MGKGKLVVYTGYSGVGKGTIMKRLRELDKSVRLSISCTTRKPRDGETNGVEYFFITKDEFEKLVEQDGFLEYARYCGNYYGTPEKAVDEMLDKGYNVFLEIEVQGGMQVMRKRPDCISIFIAPPSFEELERRLRERGTEDETTILQRLSAVEEEKKYQRFYKYTVLNDEVERAARMILSIIHSK